MLHAPTIPYIHGSMAAGMFAQYSPQAVLHVIPFILKFKPDLNPSELCSYQICSVQPLKRCSADMGHVPWNTNAWPCVNGEDLLILADQNATTNRLCWVQQLVLLFKR